MKKLIIATAFLLSSASSFANQGVHAKVTAVGCHNKSISCYAALDQTVPNPAGCTYDGAIRIDSSQSNADKVFSVLMAAKTTGKGVYAFINGAECWDGYPTVDYVTMF